MNWNEVAAVHRAWTGISLTGGSPTSILCNPRKSSPYPDEISAKRLVYYVNGPSKTKGADQLLRAVGNGVAIRVFEKAGMDDWRDLGLWTPVLATPTERGGYTAVAFDPIGPRHEVNAAAVGTPP